jgi:DNA-binding transcriptional LysR family regulator
MDDLNDLLYFTAVVDNNGFSAAARKIGGDKTRLSRRVAALEHRLGVRLLQRSTRKVVLTEAGTRFYAHCQAVVAGAQAAYEAIDELKSEPSGSVRVVCSVVMAQNYLARILPGYMALHPKVSVFIESTDRNVDLLEERFDIALKKVLAVDPTQHVSRELGRARNILVASPSFLNQFGRISHPAELSRYTNIARISDLRDGSALWKLRTADNRALEVKLSPALVTSDLRVQFETVTHGIGVALLPEPFVAMALKDRLLEQVLPEWYTDDEILHMLYPSPRGMLPSVRSLIDYMVAHIPEIILKVQV